MRNVNVLIFVIVDNEGHITQMLKGKDVIPDREYDFMFMKSYEEAELIDPTKYKVVMNGFKAELVLKDEQ